MSSLAFDTHKAVKTLTEAGATMPLAEAVVTAIGTATGDHLATKTDLGGLRKDIKGDMDALRKDFDGLRKDVKVDMGALRKDFDGLRKDFEVHRKATKADMEGLRKDLNVRIDSLEQGMTVRMDKSDQAMTYMQQHIVNRLGSAGCHLRRHYHRP